MHVVWTHIMRHPTLESTLFFFFFALTYILFVFYKCDNTLLSPSWLSPQRQQPFALFSLAISPLRRQPFALSSFAIFSKAATLYSLLLDYSQLKIPFFSLDFTLFSSHHREDPWVKAIKFFIA